MILVLAVVVTCNIPTSLICWIHWRHLDTQSQSPSPQPRHDDFPVHLFVDAITISKNSSIHYWIRNGEKIRGNCLYTSTRQCTFYQSLVTLKTALSPMSSLPRLPTLSPGTKIIPVNYEAHTVLAGTNRIITILVWMFITQ